MERINSENNRKRNERLERPPPAAIAGKEALRDRSDSAIHEDYHGAYEIHAANGRRRTEASVDRRDSELIPREAAEETRTHEFESAPQDWLDKENTKETTNEE